MSENGKRRPIWVFILEVFGLLAAIACILEWLGIKPKDLAMTQSITIPHALWLLLAIALFAIGIGSSIWSGIIQHREIARLKTAGSAPLSSLATIGREVISATSPIVVEEPQYRLKIHSASYGS